VHVVHPLHRLAMLLPGLEVVRDVDAFHHDHAVVFLLDLAPYLTNQGTVTRIDPARLQRASEGPR
jgi:hypothetical protein